MEQNFLENGFLEAETSKKVERFRNVAQVFSTYLSRKTEGRDIIAQGINSIQLFHDNERWWIVSVYWLLRIQKTQFPRTILRTDLKLIF